MGKRRLRPEEQRAWARVARTVTPLAGKTFSATTMASETADATPKRSEAGGPSPRPPDGRPNPYPHTLAPLPDRSGERRVRRGQAPIAARLDLHGHTQATAADALRRFLTAQRGEGARCVLVITGKGRDGEGVLRRRFLQWLETAEAKALASGFAPAHRKHGGGGAWYVFLRRL